jgi:hypothetical protein
MPFSFLQTPIYFFTTLGYIDIIPVHCIVAGGEGGGGGNSDDWGEGLALCGV